MLEFFRHFLFGFLSRRLIGFPRQQLSIGLQASLVSGILFLSSMRFLVLLSASGFLTSSKNLNFNSKCGRHSFSINLCISNLMFSFTSYVFVIAIATILSSDSRHQYRFIHKGNSTLNTVSSVANQTASLPFWPCYSTLNTISSIANQTVSIALAIRFYRKIHYLTSNFT